MARRTKVRRSGMFLLELMIAILFFSVASAVCAQVFVKAHQMSLEAEDLNGGVSLCCSAAEMLRSADSPAEAESLLKDRFPDCRDTQSGLAVRDADRDLLISWEKEGGLYAYTVTCRSAEGETLYELQVDRCFREVEP